MLKSITPKYYEKIKTSDRDEFMRNVLYKNGDIFVDGFKLPKPLNK